jgi:hypothetical protein
MKRRPWVGYGTDDPNTQEPVLMIDAEPDIPPLTELCLQVEHATFENSATLEATRAISIPGVDVRLLKALRCQTGPPLRCNHECDTSCFSLPQDSSP